MSKPTKVIYATNGKKVGGLAHLGEGNTPLCDAAVLRHGWHYEAATATADYKKLYGVCIKCFAIMTGAEVTNG